MSNRIKKPRRLLIGIRSSDEFFAEARAAFKRVEKGHSPIEPIDRHYFESLEGLLKALTPRRLELLQTLRRQGPLSIRKLAAAAERDYKNVHVDVQELLRLDIVKRTKDGLFEVPWDSIEMQINLAECA